MRSRALLWIALLLALPLRAVAEPTVSAKIHPPAVTLGQDARLAVTISGVRSAPQPRIPPIDGLVIQGLGQTMSMEIVNGQASSQAIHTFLVRPIRTGTFTIPALSIAVDGQRLTTQPIALQVVPAGSVPRRAAPPPTDGEVEPSAEQPANDAPVLLRIVGVPERELFVGEVIPVELHLYVREGTRVTQATPPQITGKEFTLSRPPGQEPRQSVVRYEGARFSRLVFPAALSPIRAGDLALGATLEVTAIVPERRKRAFADPFFDSFFNSGVFGRGVERRIPIESPARTVRTSALPAAGRPTDFSGGVGRFTMSVKADPHRVAVGDPVTVKTTVKGRGSFDRLHLAPSETSGTWKAYDMSSRFTQSDELGIQGQKIFEQALVPLRPDAREIPARELAYFDPDAGRYLTISVPAIPLEVLPAPAHLAAQARPAVPHGHGAGVTYELAPNRIDLGRLRDGLAPSLGGGQLVALQLLPIALLGVTILFTRRRARLERDPLWLHGRRSRHALRALTGEMRNARAAESPRAFFAAARRAIQEQLAMHVPGRVAGALTLDEIEHELNHRPELLTAVREVFLAADRVAYARGDEMAPGLGEWQARVERILVDLEGVRR